MSHACTLKVNGMSYPLELDAGPDAPHACSGASSA